MSRYVVALRTLGIAALLLIGCSPGSVMVHEQKSPYGFDQTVEAVTAKARSRGWTVPKVFDFQRSLIAHGQPDPGKIKVIKLCSPRYAGAMFQDDDAKFVSVMAPCSIAVYEKSDGHTYVASLNMRLMSKLFSGVVRDNLAKIAEEDEAIVSLAETQ